VFARAHLGDAILFGALNGKGNSSQGSGKNAGPPWRENGARPRAEDARVGLETSVSQRAE